MLSVNISQRPGVVNRVAATFSPAVGAQPNRKLDRLLADLSPDTSWGERQAAAQHLGYMRSPEAVPGLLRALPADPFWMVGCAMIQALERIGDPVAVPTLRKVARKDRFQIVRSYAAKAIDRLTREG